MSAKDVDRSQKPEGRLESRREFMRTNLGRIVAAAAIAGGINNRAAKAYWTHENSAIHDDRSVPVDPSDPDPQAGHIDRWIHTNSSYHTDYYEHVNRTVLGIHENYGRHGNDGSAS